MKIPRSAYAAVPLGLVGIMLACSSQFGNDPQSGGEQNGNQAQAVGSPSPSEVPLDPTTVPKFAQQLNIPEVWTPTPVTKNGKVVQNNYTLSVAQSQEQVLPPGFPQTVVLGYSGQAHPKGSTTSSTITVTPGAVFENTVGIPTQMHLGGQHPATRVPGGRPHLALGESPSPSRCRLRRSTCSRRAMRSRCFRWPTSRTRTGSSWPPTKTEPPRSGSRPTSIRGSELRHFHVFDAQPAVADGSSSITTTSWA